MSNTDWMWVYENPKDAAAEIDRLREVAARLATLIDWLDICPFTAPCGHKCGYGKNGDASACYCGYAEWETKRPPFVPAVRMGPIMDIFDQKNIP